MTEEKTMKQLIKRAFRKSTSTSQPCSLLGGNSNHVTTDCANPQLCNAQLPCNVFALYACANFYVSYVVCVCVCAFACAFACVFVRAFVFLQHLSFTCESRALGNYPATKNHEQIQGDFILFYISLVQTAV